MNSWLLLNSGAGSAALNMALDEALLEAMPRLGQPVLRFYSWIEPAASFGYFQKYADVGKATSLRPLVRRPTAGGVVPHDADWTYSLVFPRITSGICCARWKATAASMNGCKPPLLDLASKPNSRRPVRKL